MTEAEFKSRMLLLGAKTYIVPLGGGRVSVQAYSSEGTICWVVAKHSDDGSTDFTDAYGCVAPIVISRLEAGS